jgi:hypothetical protein
MKERKKESKQARTPFAQIWERKIMCSRALITQPPKGLFYGDKSFPREQEIDCLPSNILSLSNIGFACLMYILER